MTIFPNSVLDAESRILSFLDPLDALKLSQVNKNATATITNDLYFENYYREHYPTSAAILGEFHLLFPDISWKIAACALSHGIVPNCSFIEDSLHDSSLQLTKCLAAATTELQELCGSYYEDPNAKLDQAWKRAESARKADEEYENQYKSALQGESKELPELVEACKLLKEVHSPEKVTKFYNSPIYNYNKDMLGILCVYLAVGPEQLDQSQNDLLNTFFDLNSMNVEECGFHLHEHLIPQYKIWGQAFIKARLLSTEHHNACHEYFILERQRDNISEKIPKLNSRLTSLTASLEKGPNQIYQNLIATKDEAIQIKCTQMIDSLLPVSRYFEGKSGGNQEEPGSNILERIQALINRHSNSGDIWGNLYLYCANGVIEDRWSEKHFHEFLPSLFDIISTSNSYYSSR